MDGKQSVVVSGCSKGIGLSIVEVLIAEGFHVFGSVRRADDANRLAEQFGSSFTPLIFDVTDEASVQKAAEKVRDELKGRTLYGLINNAGYCQPAPFLHQPVSDFRYTMDANLTGVFIVSQPGRVIMMSSIQGKYGAPFMAAYTASKHGLEGLSECMRRELVPYGIDVIIVAPGFVKTAIWDKHAEKVVGPYVATAYAEPFIKWCRYLLWSSQEDRAHDPEFVAREVLEALTSGSPKTRYSPIANRLSNWTIPLILPTRWVDDRISKGLGLNKMDPNNTQCTPKAGSSPNITAFTNVIDTAALPEEWLQYMASKAAEEANGEVNGVSSGDVDGVTNGGANGVSNGKVHGVPNGKVKGVPNGATNGEVNGVHKIPA